MTLGYNWDTFVREDYVIKSMERIMLLLKQRRKVPQRAEMGPRGTWSFVH